MRAVITVTAFCSILSLATAAHAITVRYALIVGNNSGVDSDKTQPFLPLQHAEREAAKLKKTLVEYSNFDASPKRTKLLLGADRNAVKKALGALRRQKEQDEIAFGDIDALFLFYFTGHGLDGRLLLADGPLDADEVGALFTDFNAAFSVGIFDACFSGSLDRGALSAKGIRSAPGLNLFRELPEEVLSAEGRIWYVSSSRQQESYEDGELGGVFTHFFIEAIRHARPDGPGITLDSIWRYAQTETVSYTTERKRLQVPEQFINRLRSSAPIYFSFPSRRSATIVLSEPLEGKFALVYTDGALTEVFEKKKGVKQKLAVYPGQARLVLIDGKKPISTRPVTLKPESSLVLATMGESSYLPAVGEQRQVLLEKGFARKSNLSAVVSHPGLSLLGGAAYAFTLNDEMLVYARHGFRIPLRFDIRRLFLGLAFQYGYDKRDFPVWTHRVHELGGTLCLGGGFDFRKLRLGLGAQLRLAYFKQLYDDGERRGGLRLEPSALVTLLFPRRGNVQGEVFANLGAAYGSGIGANAAAFWALSGTIGAAVYFRLY